MAKSMEEFLKEHDIVEKKIKSNKIKCKYCGNIIESKSVHDFVTCKCGTVSADGGLCYLRRSFKNSPDDFIELSEYEV